MKRPVQVELLPQGKVLSVDPGSSLHDLLFAHGVEFPCGGHGRCKGCRVRVIHGLLPPSLDDRERLSPAELEAGWRLACRAVANTDLQLELAQWEIPILADHTAFPFTPQPGLGVAVDLGTTTLVAQLLDLATSHVLAVRTALNLQAQHGADIMSRIEFACREPHTLTRLIRDQLGEMIAEMVCSVDGLTERLAHVVIAGNTAMHHLFCGLDVAPLTHSPFETDRLDLECIPATALGWELPGNPFVRFLPNLGGFVGSDILAGILATRLHHASELTAMMDLGTNGEIVLGNRDRILCASTAAGPAFEGARISCGMRAATGAIASVTTQDGQFACQVLGHGPPRGLCGSGLVDAVAVSLDLGLIQPSGRLTQPPTIPLAPSVNLTQSDVRELQLAKGAIAAGFQLLARRWGTPSGAISKVYLAGAFGNYINRQSARRIGLLRTPIDRVHPAGNTALLGAKLALFSLHEGDGSYPELRRKIEHVPLSEDPAFHDVFAEELKFPQLTHP
ncbi:MAG: DUF4445 domain-containing protein [Verrucomicrobia bacterium]|nr:DUF4445 domain-containing protein [Verrucomicrobiota bacterium]